ncbi:MAG: hypothetical protein J6K96_01145 [Treponema sp.]|nr:hypothetical protein [Treponema sp.]
MCAEKKKFILDLPLKVILTEEGTSHFLSHKKQLLNLKLADNRSAHGISMEHFSPSSLQNMILLDYISRLEISMPEFVSRRQEVMDLSKVIVFSILYKQFDREIYDAMIKCECVRRHNRQNPSSLIDEKTSISDKQLRLSLSMKDSTIQAAKKTILDPVWKTIMDNSEYTPEEKNVYLLMTEKFLNRLSLMNWYIIIKFFKNDGFNEILSILRQHLASYMTKSKVAEYIAVMVMELALSSENTNIRKAAKYLYQGIENYDTLIFDPEIRSQIVKELQRKHELVSLSWTIGGGSMSIGKQGLLQIMLYNKDDEQNEVKETIESKMSVNLKKKSLVDFYRQSDGQEGTDLGLYYFSYLEDACKKVNVKFESIVNQSTASDLTVINLKFNF